mmetsp:Transcript_22645/g.33154  ORF Transcript_22645/g.33154 Transcript_22645/m.33154 type:complete len:222 (+) Transcript_22645:1157-1822(+)
MYLSITTNSLLGILSRTLSIFEEVLQMVILSCIKAHSLHTLRNALFPIARNATLCDVLLFIIVIIDTVPVLRTPIISDLIHQKFGLAQAFKSDFHQFFVGDDGWVEDDLDCLGVTGGSGAYFLVGRIIFLSLRVSHGRPYDPCHALVFQFSSPEATECNGKHVILPINLFRMVFELRLRRPRLERIQGDLGTVRGPGQGWVGINRKILIINLNHLALHPIG